MAISTKAVLFWISLALISILSWRAHAHDLQGLMAEDDNLSSEARENLRELEFYQRVLAARGGIPGREGVIDRAYVWEKDTLTVCFFGGTEFVISSIEGFVSDWTQDTRIAFDMGVRDARFRCGDGGRYDIRVSFSQPGNWSYVGTAARLIPQSDPTLNLVGLASVSGFTEDQAGTIRHEFGHALGMLHEHQSPLSTCEEEFNWEWLYSFLGSRGWERAKVDRNLKRLEVSSSTTGYILTEFDSASNLLYRLPEEAYLKGSASECFIPTKNNKPSPHDLAVIRAAYPKVSPQGGLDDIDLIFGPEVQNLQNQIESLLSGGAAQ